MQQININELRPHPRNNEFFDNLTGEKWNEFLESIKSRGVIEPIVTTQDNVIVSGHQRVRACKELGISQIMCDIHFYHSEDEVLQDLIIHNLEFFDYKNCTGIKKRANAMITLINIWNKQAEIEKQKHKAIVSIYRKQIQECRIGLINYFGNKCFICGNNFVPILQIHHILPINEHGNNELNNLICLCPTCHSIAHKQISYYKNNKNGDELFNELSAWLENNMTYNSVQRFKDLYIQYVKFSS